MHDEATRCHLCTERRGEKTQSSKHGVTLPGLSLILDCACSGGSMKRERASEGAAASCLVSSKMICFCTCQAQAIVVRAQMKALCENDPGSSLAPRGDLDGVLRAERCAEALGHRLHRLHRLPSPVIAHRHPREHPPPLLVHRHRPRHLRRQRRVQLRLQLV